MFILNGIFFRVKVPFKYLVTLAGKSIFWHIFRWMPLEPLVQIFCKFGERPKFVLKKLERSVKVLAEYLHFRHTNLWRGTDVEILPVIACNCMCNYL